jgi:hypothetical protein
MNPPEILMCFDTDGIFQCLNYYSTEDKTWFVDGYIAGPIDPMKVRNEVKPIADVYVVSESPFYPKEPDGTPMFEVINSEPGRYLNLLACYNKYWDKYGQEPKVKLYVSDNGDYNEAAKAEFTYIRHDLFLKTMESL